MLIVNRHGRNATASITGNFGSPRNRTAKEIATLANLFRNDDDGDDGDGAMDLMGVIDPMLGTGAQQFSRDLRALGPIDDITLTINSPGGDVFDAFAIFNLLEQHPAKKTVKVAGVAASAASFVAQAASPGKLFMAKNSRMMIHNAHGIVIGDAADMRKTADVLESLNGTIASIYAQRSGRWQGTFLKMMAAETWLTAQESIDEGLADRIMPVAGPGNVSQRLRELEADNRREQFNPPAIAARLQQLAAH